MMTELTKLALQVETETESTWPAWHSRPLFDYDQCGKLGHGWAAYSGHDKIAPDRLFQWEAIADLPDGYVRALPGTSWFETLEPYRVGLVMPPLTHHTERQCP